jgi:hypothetical protein
LMENYQELKEGFIFWYHGQFKTELSSGIWWRRAQ